MEVGQTIFVAWRNCAQASNIDRCCERIALSYHLSEEGAIEVVKEEAFEDYEEMKENLQSREKKDAEWIDMHLRLHSYNEGKREICLHMCYLNKEGKQVSQTIFYTVRSVKLEQ